MTSPPAADGAATPGWHQPMLARAVTLAEHVRSVGGGTWRYERKLDGLRCIAVRDGGDVALWSRNHLSFTARFPGVADALRGLRADRFVLDGELVAFDGGRDSFAALARGAPDVVLCAFDLLHLLGHDTTGLPLTERRQLLARLLDGGPRAVRPVDSEEGDPEVLLARACAAGWEGLIAKRIDSPYRPGRSGEWRKLKCQATQELVVGGWTEPRGARTGFGALLLGYWDGGDLRFAGRVGAGFDEATLRHLHARLRALETDRSPFADAGRVPAAHWCEPQLVAEIRFTEWTTAGRLRHPSFLGLRQDVDPRDVRREPPSGTAPR